MNQLLSGTWDAVSLLLLGLALLGVIMLLVLWLRRGDSARQQVQAELESFKEEVVRFSDLLDKLRERHKMLPYLDEDFRKPMEGQTKAAYEGVQTALARYRDRWLELMDIWDRVQASVRSKRFGPVEADRARASLAESNLVEVTTAVKRDCSDPLDRLELAHERAREQLTASESQWEQLQLELSEVEAAGFPRQPYQVACESTGQQLEDAEAELDADPLGAAKRLEQVQTDLAALLSRLQAVLAGRARREQVRGLADRVAQLLAERRAQGYLFAEPEGDPQPLLEEAQRNLDSMTELLARGDPDSAENQAKLADTALERAEHVVEFQQRMREYCRNEIGQLQTQVRQLQQDLGVARLTREQLQQRFATSAWAAVAHNIEEAELLQENLTGLLDAALEAADEQQQHYFHANRIVEQVRAAVRDAQQLLAALAARRDALAELEQQCKRRVEALRGETQRIGVQLRRRSEDRPLSNHRFEAASRSVEELAAAVRGNRVDWERIQERMEIAQADLDQVQQLIEKDFALAQQAREELMQSERELRRAQGYYKNGIRASTHTTERTLDEARRRFDAQDYEQAIALANDAENAAQIAYGEARREADQRQRELDRRRRQEAAAQLGVLLGAAGQAAIQVLSKSQSQSTPQRRSSRNYF